MVKRSIFRHAAIFAAVLGVSVLGSACGGGGGSSGSGSGGGLVLVNFLQAGVDNVQLNSRLELQFSGPVDPDTISPASIQIREGNAFGATVSGTFQVNGSQVFFTPTLPGLCDLSDSGFFAGTAYRVQVVGWPDQFAIRNTNGQALDQTTTWEFGTRDSSDPEKFQDQIPGQAPFVAVATPESTTAAVGVGGVNSNQVVITMSENVDPCSVTAQTVLINVYEKGDSDISLPTTDHGVSAANGNFSGFYSSLGANPLFAEDQDPGNPFSWWGGNEPGGVTSTPITGNQPQAVPASIELVQNFTETQIVISPNFRTDPSDPTTAVFPDNALIVVQLTFGITDFGGQPLAPESIWFTTEKKTSAQPASITLKNQTDKDTGETFNPHYVANGTTARVDSNTEVLQGYLLFAGDGDNGSNQLKPSLPQSNYPLCTIDYQGNDGAKDDFDPQSNVVLDTGATNLCPNTTDGSTAVVWEFNGFRIRAGRTVRIMGSNPAIILAQQGMTIEAGGRLLVRGDNTSGTPQSNGQNGQNTNSGTAPVGRAGGTGVAGAGNGANSNNMGIAPTKDGFPGFGSNDYGVQGGDGGGRGNANANKTSFAGGGNSAAGGGGGHSVAGLTGSAVASANIVFNGAVDGAGGATYPGGGSALRMLTPSAGAGGGAAGWCDLTVTSFNGYDSTGGAGAAGGGFVDLTSQGEINVFGTIDAAGGRGGSGAAGFYAGSGGGGGGSGGGVRLLTPFDINISGGFITAAGGVGGAGSVPTSGTGTSNSGGDGGDGRIVLEDDDSVITGLGSAILIPGDGQDGFFRGIFDANRFQGGGLEPQGLTDIMAFGPFNPTYIQPVEGDFIAGVPPTAAGPNVSIVIEARAYQMKADGRPDTSNPTVYATIGYFTDNGNPTAPTWNDGNPNPADWSPIGDNPLTEEEMTGLRNLADTLYGVGTPIPFIQFRTTFILPSSAGPFDPGPFIDDWTVNVTHIN